MIPENELRVGNWAVNIRNNPFQVRSKHIQFHYEMLPISLTPEILEKAGFENVGYGGGYNSFKYKKGYVILFYDETEKAAFFCYYKDENKKKGRTIRTTHDLQNLYFALTGEELEVNI